MPTNWIVPAVGDLRAILADNAIVKAGSVGAATDRSAPMLALVVERVRGEIRNASRVPVSATAGSVPPEGKYFTLILTMRALLESLPGMVQASGEKEDSQKLYQNAEDWLKEIRGGRQVTYPTDPEVTPSGPQWGSLTTIVDLTTDG